jgi:hypothetical protein
MTLLFINHIINKDREGLEMLSLVLVLFYTCVLAAVLVDLFFGVRRAKQAGVARTSYGFRRTVNKATTYFGLLIMLTIADVLASIIFSMPYFTAIGAVGLVLVETKSVFENIREKDGSVEEIPKILLELYKNKDGIRDIIGFLNETANEKKNENKDENKTVG